MLVETKDVYERAIGDAPWLWSNPMIAGKQRVETHLGVCHALVASFGGNVARLSRPGLRIFIDDKPLPFDELKP